MTCVPAPTCKAALAEASKRWPGRRTSSDGICASPQHHQQNPTSDHEIGNAFDLSHDPDHGVDTYLLADLMRRHPDGRVKYVISNGRIWNPSISPDWRTYTGANPHTHHMHVSIQPWARDNAAPWWDRYYPHPSEDDVFEYRIVTIPAVNDKGFQFQGHDVNNIELGLFHEDVNVTIKANDNGAPVKAIVQPYAYNGKLALSFIGLDGKPAPQGNVGVVLSHPPR